MAFQTLKAPVAPFPNTGAEIDVLTEFMNKNFYKTLKVRSRSDALRHPCQCIYPHSSIAFDDGLPFPIKWLFSVRNESLIDVW